MAEELGFEIYNKFYPLVRFEDWLMQDFVLSRKLTGISTDELLGRNSDSILLQQVLVAVAVSRIRRELNMDQLTEFIWGLKPSEVKEKGFEFTEDEENPPAEGDAAEQSPSVSSENSDEPTDVTPEKSTPETSGQPGSDTGSQE